MNKLTSFCANNLVLYYPIKYLIFFFYKKIIFLK